MYLSRGFLNPISRAVRADLADVASMHRTILRAFPDDSGVSPRKANGVLHRIDEDPQRGRFVLLVSSGTRPDFTRLPEGYFLDLSDEFTLATGENPAVREVSEERGRIRRDDCFVFRLLANVTRRVETKSAPDGTRSNGRRVPVRGDGARLAWLSRRATSAGFGVEDVRMLEVQSRSGRDSDGLLTFSGVQFDGRLKVADVDAFRTILAGGIGPAKAYGFGLLSVARAP